MDGGPGSDTLDGSLSGFDTVHFEDAEGDVLVRLWNDEIVATDPDFAFDVLIGIDGVRMGVGNDTVEGTSGINDLFGGPGNDLLIGLGGDDGIAGGEGDDRILAGTGNDIIYGEAGHDHLEGWGGNDIIEGGAGNDVLAGQLGNDVLMGGLGNDTLSDGPGQDTLYAEGWHDVVYSGEGDDKLDGGFGIDTLNFSAYATQVTVDLVAGTTSGPAGNDRITAFENVTGGSGNDSISGDAGGNLIRGREGADTLSGLAGHDTLVGGQGGDTLSGGASFDVLAGQEGNDTLDGGTDNDFLRGGDGADTFVFTEVFGQDVLDDFGFGGSDLARIIGAPAGYNTFADFDVDGSGAINSADAALTAKVTVGPGGELTLIFDPLGETSVTFSGVTALVATDLDFA